MAEASTTSTTNPDLSIGINLDAADRRVLITACCLQLAALGFRHDIGHWRSKAAGWDWFELLGRAEELGVELRSGGKPYHLPHELLHR
jgi:hypothetical protein